MLVISLQHGVLSGESGFTLSNFTDVLGDPLYRDVALTTFQIATIAMVIQLAIAVPIAYVLAYKAGSFEIAAAALPRARRRAQPDGPHLRLADAARPRGADQRGPAADRADRRADRRAAVQQVRGHRRALDQLPHLHRDPDLRGDEGRRPQPVRGRPRPRRRLVDDHPPGAAAADRPGDLRRPAVGLHPAVHRLRQPDAGRRHQRLHARPGGQRPRARERRPQRRRGDEPADAVRLGDLRGDRLPAGEDQAARDRERGLARRTTP